MIKRRYLIIISTLLACILLAACAQPSSGNTLADSSSDKLKVVATTTLVGDVVGAVGGEAIELVVLLPPGTDPHGFEPTPQDIAQVSDADLVFASGAGLEEFLDPLIKSAGAKDKVVHLSEDILLLQSTGKQDEDEHAGGDPHTWTDPNNVITWAHTIEQALSQADPGNAATYQSYAQAYKQQLLELDAWIQEQVAQIPENKRQIVTDHQQFAYFADEYGFTQVGAIVPAFSTMAEPSAQELAALEDAIHDLGVKAVFVGNTVNPNLAQRVAEDTGVSLVLIYTGSLSEADGQAASYLEYMRYNVSAIVNALK